jgi:hypothetical protein
VPEHRSGQRPSPPPKRGPAAPARPKHENRAEEEAKKAAELSARTGVPLWGAYRIVRGELTLNDLLQTLIRREKFEKLQKSGLDADLAGHVVHGSLDEWRASVLMDNRKAGRRRFSDDRIESTGQTGGQLGVWRFGSDMQVGAVVKARTYDFDFQPEGAAEATLVFKHDVKAVCAAEMAATIAAARRFEKKIVQEGLGASRDRKDRYRPTEELLARALASTTPIRCVFRDGTALEGRVKAFGRWDLDLVVGTAEVTVFFHALHSATDRFLKRIVPT